MDIYNDNTYLTNNPTWHAEDSAWKAKQVIDILNRNQIEPSTFCEVGCGVGEILVELHSKIKNSAIFTGYEISDKAFEICQSKVKKRLNYYLSNPFEEKNKNYYDVLLAMDVFEHIDDYFEFLKNCKQKAGYKIFHIPLELSVQNIVRINSLLKSRAKLGHLHFFTKELAIDSLKRMGYEIIDVQFTNAAFEMSNKWRTRLLNIPRRMVYTINKDFAARLFGGFSLIVLAK